MRSVEVSEDLVQSTMKNKKRPKHTPPSWGDPNFIPPGIKEANEAANRKLKEYYPEFKDPYPQLEVVPAGWEPTECQKCKAPGYVRKKDLGRILICPFCAEAPESYADSPYGTWRTK